MTNTGIAALLLCCLLTACETTAPATDAPTADAGAEGDAPGPVCEPTCPNDVSLCCENALGDNVCRAILIDRMNCGACGNVCESTCTSGVCD